MSTTENAGATPEVLLHGRYQLLGTLGSGGTGVVHRAHDAVTGEVVAVKVLSPLTTSAAMRHRREVLALRALQTPGVVRLIDEGVSDGHPFIAMEYVDGEPFPGGGRRTWDEVGPLAVALLGTLARVHAMGVIHRDLKPGNVIVDRAGRPVLLDFGLARGDTLGEAITRPDAVVGTPRYQAPEQLTGQPLDPRTDLYAVGVMLYEVLAGRPPHPLDNLSTLLAARVWRDAPPLQYAAADVPLDVCHIVDRLLARLPEARPRTANQVIEELQGLASDHGRAPFPRLGDDTLVRAALDAVHDQQPFEVMGPRGSGRTRFLRDVAEGLARTGRRAAWTTRGQRPFESLAPIVGQPDTLEFAQGHEPGAADPTDVAAQLVRRLRETLAGGTVVLVDDAEDVDPWSSELLEQVRPDSAVIRAWQVAPGPARVLAPLGERDLRALFHGPDRLLHLREDAAHALLERTGGRPARVVAEVAAWVSGGFATWRDGLLALDRTALDRLEGGVSVQVPAAPTALAANPLKRGLERMLAWVTLAWPHSSRAILHEVCGGGAWEIDMMLTELERVGAVRRTADGRYEPLLAALTLQDWAADERREAHGALAARIAPGGVGRFAHLVAAGEFVGAANDARHVAERLAADGYVGRAVGVLSQGLYAAREAADAALEEALLVDLTRIAMAENVAGSLKHVRYEIARAAPTPLLETLDALLAVALAAVNGDARALVAGAATLGPYDDPTLEVWRRALLVQAAFRRDRGVAADTLAEQMRWAEASGSSFIRGRAYGWMGMARYTEGLYSEAAAWHTRALPLKEGAADRLSSMLNAASAFLEAFDLEEALRFATEAEALAAERRLAFFEARAAWIRRSVEYRLAATTGPDLELVDAVVAMGSPRFAATVYFSEGAAAWRAEHPAASRLARAAAALFAENRQLGPLLACNAIALAAEGVREPGPWRDVAEQALTLEPGIASAQVLGLVAVTGVVWEPAWSEACRRCLAASAPGNPHLRRSVLADAEVLAYLRETDSRPDRWGGSRAVE